MGDQREVTRTEQATLTHIFTVSGVPEDLEGHSPSHALNLGRFRLNLDIRAEHATIVTVFPGDEPLPVATRARQLGSLSLAISLWHDRSGLGQVHVRHQVGTDVDSLIANLRHFCHERDSLTIDGLPFLERIASELGIAELDLQQDVLQFVELPTSAMSRLVKEEPVQGTLTNEAVGLIYRDEPRVDARGQGTIRVPQELNRDRNVFAAHGRGVVVTCGQSDVDMSAIRLIASELLLAVGRAKESRGRLQSELRNAQVRDARLWADQESLESLHNTVRDQRLALALDVRAFADGLFMPEIVLDDFRRSFAAALRLGEIVESSSALLDTLSEIVGSYLERAGIEKRKQAEVKQRRWQFVAGTASGVAIPLALLLTYFGVSSRVQVPQQTSIFDLSEHATPWLLAIAVSGLVVGLSAWQFYRSTAAEV